VVAVRDGGDYAGHNLRYKNECLPLEKLPICLRSAGKAWRASGRYGRLIGRPPSGGNSLAKAIAHGHQGLDHVKIVNSGLNSLTEFGEKTLPQFNADQLRTAVRTADGLGLMVMVHANGKLPVKLAIEAGCHSIEHGFFMGKENLRRMADRQVTWTPTVYTMKAYHESLDNNSVEQEISLRNLEHQMNQISLAVQYGVPIAIGTDCGSLGVHHGAAFVQELGLILKAGMPLEKGIQCATQNGAKTLGVQDILGRLGTGMPATFVAVMGNPSSLPGALNAPEKIFIRGEAWEP
jgi:imidazolonepropionase-like amidohydrolase